MVATAEAAINRLGAVETGVLPSAFSRAGNRNPKKVLAMPVPLWRGARYLLCIVASIGGLAAVTPADAQTAQTYPYSQAYPYYCQYLQYYSLDECQTSYYPYSQYYDYGYPYDQYGYSYPYYAYDYVYPYAYSFGYYPLF